MIVVTPLAEARSAAPIDAPALADIAALCQHEPSRYQAYFGDDVSEIAAEIEGVDAWDVATTVALEDGELTGWLLAERDEEIGRVWWWGPVVADGFDWLEVGGRLLDVAHDGFAGRFEQFEFAVDARHSDAALLAEHRGYRRDPGSVLLRLDLGDRRDAPAAPVDRGSIATPGEVHAEALASLHEELFPNSHLTGTQLVGSAAEDIVLVATGGGDHEEVLGYVRAEVQSGGGGYVDFLGVAPPQRNTGLGRALVDRAVEHLATRGVTDVTLTVREDNAAARALYRRLGFDGSRILVPFRLGFTP